MKKKNEARILGPYEQHNGWRVVEVDRDGKRDSVMFPTEAKALRYIEILKAEVANSDHTTESAFALYKQHLQESGYKPDAIVTEEWAADLFFPEPIPLSSITAKRCEDLYRSIRTTPRKATGKPFAADTHRAALSRVKTFLGWCASPPRNWIKENPFAGVQGIGKLRPRGKSLGKAGNELSIKQARQWDAKALELADSGDVGAIAGLTAMYLGMRPLEIVSRVVRDVDEDEMPGDVLWIPCSKTPAGRRTLEVPDPLRELLVRLCGDRESDRPLFELSRGVPHDSDWVRKQVARVCKAAGVPVVTAYAMRGALATISAERGLAGYLIAATLGHSSYERMSRKAYVAPGAHEKGVNRGGLAVLQGGRK